MLLGLGASTVVFALGIAVVARERKRTKQSSPIVQFRWIVMLCVLLLTCALLYDFVQGKMYGVHMLAANKQHFANVHWLKQYAQSL